VALLAGGGGIAGYEAQDAHDSYSGLWHQPSLKPHIEERSWSGRIVWPQFRQTERSRGGAFTVCETSTCRSTRIEM
jgi:hypothetical protein